MSNSQPKVEAFLSALKKQSFFKNESTPGSVLWYIAFYQKRAPQRRKAFRITGFVVLCLSISLPSSRKSPRENGRRKWLRRLLGSSP